jgi:CheY-like chemotaxis protein
MRLKVTNWSLHVLTPLPAIKNVIDMHGGKFLVFSEGRRLGTTYTIYLPLAIDSRRSSMRSNCSVEVNAPYDEGIRFTPMSSAASSFRVDCLADLRDHVYGAAAIAPEHLEEVPLPLSRETLGLVEQYAPHPVSYSVTSRGHDADADSKPSSARHQSSRLRSRKSTVSLNSISRKNSTIAWPFDADSDEEISLRGNRPTEAESKPSFSMDHSLRLWSPKSTESLNNMSGKTSAIVRPFDADSDEEISLRYRRQNSLNGPPKDGLGQTDHSQRRLIAARRVLLVDDSVMTRKMMRRTLKEQFEVVDEAGNGLAGCEKLREAVANGEPYDVILMDYQMPIMDGPTAVMTMRAEGYDGLIVGVTGNGLTVDIHNFKRKGANAVLLKPLKIGQLQSLILVSVTICFPILFNDFHTVHRVFLRRTLVHDTIGLCCAASLILSVMIDSWAIIDIRSLWYPPCQQGRVLCIKRNLLL